MDYSNAITANNTPETLKSSTKTLLQSPQPQQYINWVRMFLCQCGNISFYPRTGNTLPYR